MHILITGGGGFLGQRLLKSLLNTGTLKGHKITGIIVVDQQFPEDSVNDLRVKLVEGDFADETFLNSLVKNPPDVLFHLAAIVSGEAEKDYELGMEVNLHSSLALLEVFRKSHHAPIFVFASSCAVFGGDVKKSVRDDIAPLPRSSYGTQKAIMELLIDDYSRRNWVDGRSLRLPTIAIRPGKANAATSSFVSGIIREPVTGVASTYPVDNSTEVWIQSPETVIQNFIHAATIDRGHFTDTRIITLPGLTVSIFEMIEALKEIAGENIQELIRYEPDEFLQSIVLTWPPKFEISHAENLGFKKDKNIYEIIKSHIREELPARFKDFKL